MAIGFRRRGGHAGGVAAKVQRKEARGRQIAGRVREGRKGEGRGAGRGMGAKEFEEAACGAKEPQVRLP